MLKQALSRHLNVSKSKKTANFCLNLEIQLNFRCELHRLINVNFTRTPKEGHTFVPFRQLFVEAIVVRIFGFKLGPKSVFHKVFAVFSLQNRRLGQPRWCLHKEIESILSRLQLLVLFLLEVDQHARHLDHSLALALVVQGFKSLGGV